jgi:5,10-methylenetetrahydromethanopterin reductase
MCTNPVTRHPVVMASAFAAAQALSGGRAWLGIGTGNNAVRNLGLPPATLADLEAYIVTFRELIQDGKSTFHGNECALPWPPEVIPGGVPVYVAANGPKSLALAGRVADGVIVGGGVSKGAIDQQMSYLEAGARSVGRSVDDLDIWFQAMVSITDSYEHAVEDAKDILSAIASRNFRFTLEGKQLPEELVPAMRQFETEYHYAEHCAGFDHNGSIIDRLGLTDFLSSLWVVGGTVDDTVSRLRELESLGVENVLVVGVGDRPRLLDNMRHGVMPQLSGS